MSFPNNRVCNIGIKKVGREITVKYRQTDRYFIDRKEESLQTYLS